MTVRGESGMATVLNRLDDSEKFAVPQVGSDDGYRPSADEEFMNPRQQAYFRAKLQGWKDSILREAAGTISQLQVSRIPPFSFKTLLD